MFLQPAIAALLLAMPAVAQAIPVREVVPPSRSLVRGLFLSAPDRFQLDGRPFDWVSLSPAPSALSASDTFLHISNRVIFKGTVFRVDAQATFANEAFSNRFNSPLDPQLGIVVPILLPPGTQTGKDIKVLFSTGIAF